VILCAEQYEGQVDCTKDASLVIGIHGAGLTLAVFAPTNASSLLEIVPKGFALDLFGAVTSYGLDYSKVLLSEHGTKRMVNIGLRRKDKEKLKSKIMAMVQAGKSKIKAGNVGM
jgi:capsular polysaccharide biosynthesis protein